MLLFLGRRADFGFELHDALTRQVSAKFKINVSGFRIPSHVVGDAVHPAFGVRLQFLPEIVQDN